MKFFFLTLFVAVTVHAQTPKEITIGFLPGADREAIKKGTILFAKSLQQQIGVPINLYIPKSYSTLVEAIRQKKVDFAFLSAASYVAAEKLTPMKVLLKKVWVAPFYHSVIMVRSDSKFKKIEDLKNHRIAFVDAKSTSGYLYPQVMLHKKGFKDGFFSSVKFSGSHSESVALLEKKEVDAIAVFSDDTLGKQSAWVKFSSDKNVKKIRVLWSSDPIPNDPICVRQDFYDQNPKLVHTLMFALIDVYDKLKGKKEIVDVLGAHGFLPATSRQYDPVREMVKELNIKLDE